MKRGTERGEQRKEEELLKSRKACGESELQRYASIGPAHAAANLRPISSERRTATRRPFIK